MSAGWRRATRFGVGLAILLLVVVGVSPAAIAEHLGDASVGLVVVGVTGLVAAHLIAAAGWRAILATSSGIALPWRTAVTLYYAAQAIGGVTPANLGGDVHRAVTLRGSGHGWSVAVAPVIVQRATSYLALAALALVATVTLAAGTELGASIVVIGLAFSVAVAAAALLLLAPPGPMRPLHARLVRLVSGGTEATDARIEHLAPASMLGMATGVAFHAAGIGFTWLIVVAVDPSLPAPPVVAALTLARLGLAVPLSPSGLGVQEGVLAALLSALGLPPQGALAAMLLARIALVLTTLIGVALLLRPTPRLPAAHPIHVAGGR